MQVCRLATQRRLESFVEPFNDAMHEFDIDTPQREAAFIAQVAHESGEFRYVKEIATGDAYEHRADLGNLQPGDGRRFRGRGLIQITGRDNYRKCGDALGVDLVADPELLEGTVLACRSAAWFWKDHGLNELADASDFRRITIRINGGLTGWQNRVQYWVRAKEVLGVP
jgi:putative chitinase